MSESPPLHDDPRLYHKNDKCRSRDSNPSFPEGECSAQAGKFIVEDTCINKVSEDIISIEKSI